MLVEDVGGAAAPPKRSADFSGSVRQTGTGLSQIVGEACPSL